ncbi:MAG: P1 family peptidase [Opitutales bacterium]|nr:P1 family peptidase [Opitutales bacterium]
MFRCFSLITVWVTLFGLSSLLAEPRARDLGVPFSGEPGPLNAITDVPGVRVGHQTLIRGEGDWIPGEGPVRTGVTAILPTGMDYRPVFAGWSTLNGNGEMTGAIWIEESGFLEEPILLTSTHSVGAVADASIAWRRERGYHDAEDGFSWASLPVVAETWDGRLNDMHGSHISREDVFAALDGAAPGPVEEGNVGGGTGMVAHRFKAGIGTASRVVEGGYTLGVLVQANYGRREDLTIAGVPVGREISNYMPELMMTSQEGNSIIVIIATDAPLLPHQLKRISRRATVGLARLGGFGANSSGDIFLAFSTAEAERSDKDDVWQVPMLENTAIDGLFIATAEATEEAIVNALVAAETMTGINDNRVYAIPHERLQSVLRDYRRLEEVAQ